MMHQKIVMFLLLSLLTIGSAFSQIYFSDNGEIEFDSDAPLEMIKASSKQLKGSINTSNQFAFIVKIISFEGFNNGLQKDHFNENYMESEKFPKATFTGKIIENINFEADGVYNVRAKGKLNIHGVEQIRIIKSKLTIKDGIIKLTSKFKVPLVDHNISIPKIVAKKIATEINVTINATLKEK